jgi:death-on-curing family protein
VPEFVVLNMGHMQAAHGVLVQIFGEDEPIPEWHEGHAPTLEMCCNCTEVEAFGQAKYPDLPSRAAKLFYSTIKNHPFPNANKRMAFVITLGYIAINDHRLTAPEGVGYEVAKWVADTDPQSEDGKPDKVIAALATFFRDNIEPYDWATFVAERATTAPDPDSGGQAGAS